MSSIVYVTAAGVAALQNGLVTSTAFKLGSAFGYNPDETDDDVRGTTVYSGVPSSPSIVSSQIYRYTIALPSTLDTSFGEIGLFLQNGSLFALVSFAQSILVSPNPLDDDDVGGTIDVFVQSDGTAFVDLNSGTAFAEALTLNQLPSPSVTDAKFYVVPDPANPHLPLLVYRKDVLWSYEGYTLLLTGIVTDSTLSSVVFSGTPVVPVYSIVEFKTGALTGITRIISTTSVAGPSTTLGFSAPLTSAPVVGSEFMLFAAPEIDVAYGGLLADGSIPFTGNQSLANHKLTDLATPTSNGDATNKEYVDTAIASAPLSVTQNVDMQSFKVVNLGTPTASGDGVNKSYVDSGFLKLDGTSSPTADLPLNNHKLLSLAAPTTSTDAATKGYVDSGFVKLDGSTPLMGNLSAGNYRITNLADPTSATDAVSRGYVEGLIRGMEPKAPVRVVATANVNLATPDAVLDSVALSNGDRILLAGQTNAAQNGVYTWINASTPLTRTSDMTTGTIKSGAYLWAKEGTTYADSLWVLITDTTITIDTTPLTFFRFGSNFANGLVRADGTIPFTGHQSLGGYRLTNLGSPSASTDAISKSYLDTTVLRLDGSTVPTTVISWGNQRLSNLAAPTSSGDATSKSYVDGLIANAWKLDGSATPTANQTLGGYKLTNVGIPTASSDAATKAYADSTRNPRIYTNSTASGAVSVDLSLYDNAWLTLTGNVTVNFTAPVDGKTVVVRVQQDATGGRTLGLANTINYTDAVPSLAQSLAPNAVYEFALLYDAARTCFYITRLGLNAQPSPVYSWDGVRRTYTLANTGVSGTGAAQSLPKGLKLWKSVLSGSGSVTLDADVEVSANGSSYSVLATINTAIATTEYFSSIEDWAYHRVVIRTITGTSVNWTLTALTED